MDPNQISIVVTVYSRRQYIKQSLASALNQTIPVRVFVVEDCGPDPGLEAFVKNEFGPTIRYIRNPKRRGIFGNWNAALDLCETEWLSILHDDDYLSPVFVESMIELAKVTPNCGLYYGQTGLIDEKGESVADPEPNRWKGTWRRVGLSDALFITPFPFPGQLFPVHLAKKLGGFRETSHFCGDWEMWTNLIADSGGAQTGREVAFNRCHTGWDRGCTQIVATGRHLPVTYIQIKRVLALMRPNQPVKFDREGYIRRRPVSVRFLLGYGATLRPRLLDYYVRHHLMSKAPHRAYAIFQGLARAFGTRFVRLASVLWIRISKFRKAVRSK